MNETNCWCYFQHFGFFLAVIIIGEGSRNFAERTSAVVGKLNALSHQTPSTTHNPENIDKKIYCAVEKRSIHS